MILKPRWMMYEGCETVLAPLAAVLQAALTRLRNDRFVVAFKEGAGRVLYECGKEPSRDEVSVDEHACIGTRPCLLIFVGVRRGVGSESSSSSLSESE